MNELHQDIIFNFFSRLPIKSLLRLRCVSKRWRDLIDDPNLTIIQMKQVKEEPIPLLTYHSGPMCLHFVKEENKYTVKAKEDPILELGFKNQFASTGSCNGLIYFTEPGGNIMVTNPLRGECYKLPPLKNSYRKIYGLGFDSCSNRFKMVCVFVKERITTTDFQLGTMVHDLGTSSWRETTQIPTYLIRDGAVFAYGCLHWMIMSYDEHYIIDTNEIVSFDVRKEEFSLTTHPKLRGVVDILSAHLVDLKGELGLVDLSCGEKVEIWVMKDYGKKEWVAYCCINMRAPSGMWSNKYLEVIGLWKDGEILIESREGFFLYSLKTGIISYIFISCPKPNPTICIYQGSLISIRNIMAEKSLI